MDPPAFYLLSKVAAVLTGSHFGFRARLYTVFLYYHTYVRGEFSLVWFSHVFDWALFRNINVDQRNGKTESERDQRLLEMTI